jgi:HK97 family phage portal protein
MSLLTRYFEQRSAVTLGGHPRDPGLADFFGPEPSKSGVAVTEKTALGWTALSSGIRLLAETIAAIPLDLCERLTPRGRKQRPDHPALAVLREPNDEMTGFELRELLQGWAVWFGTGYAQIVWNGAGYPMELWPLSPDRVQPQRNSAGQIEYRVSLPNQPFGMATQSAVLPADEMLVIRGFSRYGLFGDRITQTFREAIGLGLATEIFGARFFGQGANASGVLQHPAQLSDDAQLRLIKQKENQVSGIDKAHKIMILEEGMTWHQTTVDPEKAQFLGTRKFQVTECARILRIPPHMLYDLERATFSNIEHQGIEVVTYTMVPWAIRWEQRLAKQLLGLKDFSKLYFKFNMDGLLRGDMAARMAFFHGGIQDGYFSQNDVREYLDLNPIDGGDTYLRPNNLTPVNLPAPTAPAPPAPYGGSNDNGTENKS